MDSSLLVLVVGGVVVLAVAIAARTDTDRL
jgi:hypothetical protein